MAVNVGARCLAEGTGVFKAAHTLLQALDIPPDRLTFELTESALIDTTVPGLLTELQSSNERLSIDDFGTGYSSLVYLQRLPVIEIKADKSFVTTMATVTDDAAIVRSIIDLAHNLSIKVVAEGVEDAATMELLIAYGCDTAQGFYFARPVTSDELPGWLESSPYGLARTTTQAGPVPLKRPAKRSSIPSATMGTKQSRRSRLPAPKSPEAATGL
jgi:EAL domain-containing protein (putative c-di-GMP-specific phosphodiesterase class I)